MRNLAPNTVQPPKRNSIFSERYGVPWNIIVGIVGAVIGIIVSLFFYKLAEQRKQLAYTNSTPAIRIFDSKSAVPEIKVLDALNEPINEDIYVAEITLWNAGNVTIPPGDVLQELRVLLYPVRRIISLKITDSTFSNIANYKVSLVEPTSEGSQALARVSWDHLEPGFAVKFQVTYTSEPTSDNILRADMQGFISGANLVRTGRYDVDNSKTPDSIITLIILAFNCVFAIILYMRSPELRAGNTSRSWVYRVLIALLLITTTILLADFLRGLLLATPAPPL